MPLLQGARRQPKGFTRYQVIATALDPRTMTLYGVREEEHSDVWDVVVEELVNRMAEEDAAAGEKVATAAASAAAAPAAAAAATTRAAATNTEGGSSTSAGGDAVPGAVRKKPRLSGFMRQSLSVSRPQPPVVPEQHLEMSPISRYTGVALHEVGLFRKETPLPMYEDEEQKIPTNPLLWWKIHAVEFPQLAKLARRVLCIPATSAPSERIFSVAGLTATKKRNRLAPESVTLLVYLRGAWQPAEAWRKLHPVQPTELAKS